jgi:hypothetical protein
MAEPVPSRTASACTGSRRHRASPNQRREGADDAEEQARAASACGVWHESSFGGGSGLSVRGSIGARAGAAAMASYGSPRAGCEPPPPRRGG